MNTQLINGVNLIPIYRDDDRYEANALAAWEAAMPTWQHIPVDATELLLGWGNPLHPDGSGQGSVHLFSQPGEDLLRLQLFSATMASLSSEPAP